MNLRPNLIGIDCRLVAAGNRNLIAKDTLVRTAGVGQEDGDNEGAGSGCWILDAGCSMLDTGCWFLVSGHLLLVSGDWILVPCYRLSVTGRWLPVARIVNSGFYWLTHGIILFSFCYHYNLAVIFSMGLCGGNAFFNHETTPLKQENFLKQAQTYI